MARWDNEEMVWNRPDIDKIPCKDCALRAKDRKSLGISGATLGVCDAYPDVLNPKPDDVLFDGAKCPHYKKDSSAD